MIVIANIEIKRPVEIPDECFKNGNLTEQAYKKYMGEKSCLLEKSENCVNAIYNFNNEVIAEY